MRIALAGLGKMGGFYDALFHAAYIIDVKPRQGRVCFNNVEEFIFYGQPVDIVVVATPSSTHFTISKKLLHAGYDVLVEKPIALSSRDSKELEEIAKEKNRVLCQSTPERYNPIVKFLQKHFNSKNVARVESSRFGAKPPHAQEQDAKFDLGIHDVDLWTFLFNKEVPWTVNAGYGDSPKREIIITCKDGTTVRADLLHKFVSINGRTLDFAKTSGNNPIIEMMYDISQRGTKSNEAWHEEIEVLERVSGFVIELIPE